MTYLLIGHTESESYYGRCGDLVQHPGKFETKFFRDDRQAFIQAWAHATIHETFDDLTVVISGVPLDHMTDDEYDELYVPAEAEMIAHQDIVRAERDAAKKAEIEAAAQAAVQKARKLAQAERDHDLAQLAVLQRKLGLK